MNSCKECKHMDNSDTYPSTCYCTIYFEYVREDDSCEDFEE